MITPHTNTQNTYASREYTHADIHIHTLSLGLDFSNTELSLYKLIYKFNVPGH